MSRGYCTRVFKLFPGTEITLKHFIPPEMPEGWHAILIKSDEKYFTTGKGISKNYIFGRGKTGKEAMKDLRMSLVNSITGRIKGQ